MEESLKKFKQFLNQIFWAETETDEFRVKLCSIAGAKRKIFFAIDQQFNNSITSEDICNFCNLRGIRTTQETQEVLGRYFRNWNEGINYEEFLEVMKPKNTSLNIQESQFVDPIKVFILMVNTIIKSFENLQVLRQKLQVNYNFIIKYFDQKYSIRQCLTKDDLKKFMIDQNIYTKPKYQQVCNYIYGDTQTQISWKNLFNLKSSEIILQNLPNKKTYSVEVSQECCQNDNLQTFEPNLIKKSTEQCSNIHDVIAQIQQIEKQLKQKRLKGIKSQPISPIKPVQQKQTFIGRVKAQNKINNKAKQRQKKAPIQEQQEQFSYIPLKGYQQSLQYTPHQKYLGKTTNFKPRNLNSVNSQAKLKIQQIQRRAMDKYLSSRRDNYLPNDNHVPYYYNKKEPLQFIRQRSLQNLSKGQSFNQESNYQPIYTRNKASRMLYTDGAFMERPISPHLLRY